MLKELVKYLLLDNGSQEPRLRSQELKELLTRLPFRTRCYVGTHVPILVCHIDFTYFCSAAC